MSALLLLIVAQRPVTATILIVTMNATAAAMGPTRHHVAERVGATSFVAIVTAVSTPKDS